MLSCSHSQQPDHASTQAKRICCALRASCTGSGSSCESSSESSSSGGDDDDSLRMIALTLPRLLQGRPHRHGRSQRTPTHSSTGCFFCSGRLQGVSLVSGGGRRSRWTKDQMWNEIPAHGYHWSDRSMLVVCVQVRYEKLDQGPRSATDGFNVRKSYLGLSQVRFETKGRIPARSVVSGSCNELIRRTVLDYKLQQGC
jgi:hypothetical protein